MARGDNAKKKINKAAEARNEKASRIMWRNETINNRSEKRKQYG